MTSSFIPKALLIPAVLFLTTVIFARDISKNLSSTPSGFPNVNKYSYLSPVGLKSLFALEGTLYKNLSQYAAGLKPSSLTQQLQLYLADYEESTLKVINGTGKEDNDSIENLSRNPILAFRVVWRFVKYLRRWAEPGVVMPKNQASKFKDLSLLLAQHYNASDGPTSSDLDDARMALTKLVATFNLDIQHFAAGNICGRDAGMGLTAAQCIEIGWFAMRKQLYVTGVEFIEAALDKIEEERGDLSVKLSKAREQVRAAYNAHDDAFNGMDASVLDIDFFTKTLQEVNARTERTRRREVVASNLERNNMQDESLNHKYRFQTICKGMYGQGKRASSKLFCWYEHQVDPTFKIGPLQAEFVAPQVVKFHRLISLEAISQLKKNISTTFRELRESREGSNRTVKDFPERLGAFTDLHPSESATARLIANLAGRATGLQYKERNFRAFHITVYTPGSYQHCHQDVGTLYKHAFATFMVYLSNVEEGGGTGFCENGVVVKPEVGSAVLWFNMLSSGMWDVANNHCSCPVVFGEKWVSLTYIYMGPQSHLQCDQDQSKKHEYLVNKKSVAELFF